MAKYMVLYNASVTASDLMAKSTPDEMQAGMAAWLKWRDEASKSFKVDFGMPLQVDSRITPDGVTSSDNPASGYSMVEGDSKEDLLELLKSHPHLKTEGASIDLLEMLAMPGM